jgi:AcrR family transcriptional regulator
MSPTQAERSAATQQALLKAARALWGERGFAAVGTPEIAKAAGVTRGAMYHQFADKTTLFVAVLESVEEDVMGRLGEAVIAATPSSPADALHVAADAWLEIATEPEIRQLLLLDATSVLGWAGFRDISLRFSLGMTEKLLAEMVAAGQLPEQPVRPLAHILIAAIDEAAMVVADADDPASAQADMGIVIHGLIAALGGDSRSP